MSLYRVAATMAVGLIALGSKVSHADFVLSFDPSQLKVQATGGVVHQTVDLLITHDGVGSNLFSIYDIELNPAARVTIAEGLITTSDFTFDLGHQVLSSAPWSILGANNVANNSVTFGGTNLLARLSLSKTSFALIASVFLANAYLSLGKVCGKTSCRFRLI